MQLLLDSHTWVWFLTQDKKIPTSVRSLIEDKCNSCLISIASWWEIAIKYSLGRIFLNNPLQEIFEDAAKSGFETLQLTQPHLLLLATLDHHHRDPFDRIMIAQAIHEDLTIVTKDAEFKKYPVNVIWK